MNRRNSGRQLRFKPTRLVLVFSLVAALVAPLAARAQVGADGEAAVEDPQAATPSPPPRSPGEESQAVEEQPLPRVPLRAVPVDPRALLEGPRLVENPAAPVIESAQPAGTDEPLPINLATALYLSNARPLVIAHAQASVEQAAAQLQGANVLWLPNFNVGVDYFHHDGAEQKTEGNVIFGSRSSFGAGGGLTLNFGLSEAIFGPLVARQVLAARQCDLQAARNDALLSVAVAYFDVQQSRGRLAGALDAAAKAEDLTRRVASLAKGVVPEMEVDRARSFAADINQQVATARTDWRVTSARLNRILRLNPAGIVIPLEPPQLQVTLIAPGYVVDDLIAVGLLNRPELASRRALVQATLDRLRQERLRPLIPSVVLQGRGPYGALNGAVFGGGVNDEFDTWGGRFDMELGAVWTLENLGLGNRALVRGRAAERRLATIEFFNVQDQVAEEVVQARAQVDSSGTIVAEAEAGLKEAIVTFKGTLEGLSVPRIVPGGVQFISRPQEAVAALQQLNRAYGEYYTAVNDYNRAQFRLYHALGYPSRILACDRPAGEVRPVDTHRPPQMAPVCPHVIASPQR